VKEIIGIHHASVLVSDLAQALRFYVDVLGIEIDSSRPTMPFDGAWLTLGNQQIHLLQLPSPEPLVNRPEHAGRDRHTALSVRDLDALVSRLEQAGITMTHSRSGRRAVFCRDPDGNGIELVEVS
jgi:glyoxylase I family protein